jgi:hypothetical protein
MGAGGGGRNSHPQQARHDAAAAVYKTSPPGMNRPDPRSTGFHDPLAFIVAIVVGFVILYIFYRFLEWRPGDDQ